MAATKLQFSAKAVIVNCTDHRRSEEFYRKTLGATTLQTRDTGFGCPWLKLGSLKITLVPNASERSSADSSMKAMTMLWVEVNDLKAATKRFAKSKVEIVDPGDGQFMQIADPDGLVIEVWQK